MLTSRNKQQLADEANTLAKSFEMVLHGSMLYIPADCETLDTSVVPDQERKIWIPVTQVDLQRKSAAQFGTLFTTETELMNFRFMVEQCAERNEEPQTSLLVRTKEGTRELREDGKLHGLTGRFVPNYLSVELNEDEEDKHHVMSVLTEWLNSEEEAIALLRHLATALAPGWSAVKYVLLIGDGRNGKSVLMKMMRELLGPRNVSSVSRQDMSESKPVVTELNGKLLNLVFDGVAVYLKDSGNEKTLVAGEPLGVRKLYSNTLTTVRTNALFIEGLNKEPKSSDKSSALQARLVRFHFPNMYEEDLAFQKHMLSEKMLGAFLALLLDNYVKPEEKAVMLAQTSKSEELKQEHMLQNSLALQFVAWLEETEPLGAETLLGMDLAKAAALFRSWRLKQDDVRPWTDANILEMLQPVAATDRKGRRVDGRSVKVRVITEFKPETKKLIESIRGRVHELVVDE